MSGRRVNPDIAEYAISCNLIVPRDAGLFNDFGNAQSYILNLSRFFRG